MSTMSAGDYEETLADIEESIGIVPGFMSAIPEDALLNEWPMFKQYALGESVFSPKQRELIELAVAAMLKCRYCSAFHKGAAELHGATEAEIAEVGVLASMTARWSTMIHAQDYDYETFLSEFDQIGNYLQEQQAGD
jgi:AhpD family alkylhydroperoxidase